MPKTTMPFSTQFEKYYYKSGRDIDGDAFTRNSMGYYRSKNTYREYQWFAHGYREAMRERNKLWKL